MNPDGDHLAAASKKNDPLYDAVETLLKGPEISLGDHGQPAYKDKGGDPRDQARIRWWDSEALTLRQIAEMDAVDETADGDRYPELPEVEPKIDTQSCLYTRGGSGVLRPLLVSGRPGGQKDWTERTACVDFSAVKGGALTAYRWSGEAEVERANYHQLGVSWDFVTLPQGFPRASLERSRTCRDLVRHIFPPRKKSAIITRGAASLGRAEHALDRGVQAFSASPPARGSGVFPAASCENKSRGM